MTAALSPLAENLRRHDRDRYHLSLFAPAAKREAVIALYSFNYEIARIRESIREPMLGLIRLQWWRDALEEIYAGARPRHHDVVEPLAGAIAALRPAKARFTAILDARARDMDEAPPESLAALEAYAAATSGTLNLLVLDFLGIEDDATRAAANAIGIAYALTGLLLAAPFHARAKRLYLPQELIRREAVDLDRSLFDLKPSPALAAVVCAVADRARTYLDEGRRQRSAIPRAAQPALLPGVLAAWRLKQLERAGHNILDPRLAAVDTLQSLRLTWAAFGRRF